MMTMMAPCCLLFSREYKVLPLPLFDSLARNIGIGVLGLDRVIDDDVIAALAGERTPDRCGQARAHAGGHEFIDCRFPGEQARLRKGLEIPGAAHQGAALLRERGGQILTVACAQNAPAGIVTQN